MPRLASIALLLVAATANAKVTARVTLDQLVKEQPLILIVKVSEFLPEKAGMVLTPVEKLRGDFPFERVPVNLKGDKEAIKEKQPEKLAERLGKDVVLVVFASRDERFFDAVAYTNGTWIRLAGVADQQDGKEVTRWRFVHCETYFRRTYKGSTDDLIKAVRGGLKGEKLPPFNDKEEPGYGPPLRKPKKGTPEKEPLSRTFPSVVSLPFGVIQIPFLGLIAALAALFPAVFGGAALLMRRWVAAFSVASFVSILSALVLFLPGLINWTGLRSVSSAWLAASAISGLGALWASYRYRRAIRDGRGEDFQPRYLDRIALAVLVLVVAGCTVYAWLANQSFRESPWLELLLLLAPTTACLYFVLAHRLRSRGEPKPVAISAETVALWAGAFGCGMAGIALMIGPQGPSIVAGGDSVTVKLDPQPLWVFEPKKGGEIVSTPCVTPERIFVAVHHRPFPTSQFGTVYALDPNSGSEMWKFDRDPNKNERLKPVFSSPIYADGRLYFGEGYHKDQDSKLFCLDAATGKKIWAFATSSHTESSPAVAEGKVVFGAGDDGMYCLDAATGQKIWQFPAGGGLHIDSNPLIHDGKVYAGSGTSKKSKNTRIFCVDLKTGQEIWGEQSEYSVWGSPSSDGKHVYFGTGNGTFSEDREPIAGMVLCRDADTGRPIWQRAIPNSVVGRPAFDRYQLYVGCRDGNCYTLDRQTGEVVWSKTLQSPVLASPTIDVNPQMRTGEVLYAIGQAGQLEALSPADGSLFWAISFRSLIEVPYVYSISTPVVVRENRDGMVVRRVYVGLGFGPSADATPKARLYCFVNTSN